MGAVQVILLVMRVIHYCGLQGFNVTNALCYFYRISCAVNRLPKCYKPQRTCSLWRQFTLLHTKYQRITLLLWPSYLNLLMWVEKTKIKRLLSSAYAVEVMFSSCLCVCVCVCVCLSVCFCLGYNFWTRWHENFIFGMVVHLDQI